MDPEGIYLEAPRPQRASLVQEVKTLQQSFYLLFNQLSRPSTIGSLLYHIKIRVHFNRLDIYIRRLFIVNKLYEILTSNSLKFYLILISKLDLYTSGSYLLRYYLFIILVDIINKLVLNSYIQFRYFYSRYSQENYILAVFYGLTSFGNFSYAASQSRRRSRSRYKNYRNIGGVSQIDYQLESFADQLLLYKSESSLVVLASKDLNGSPQVGFSYSVRYNI